MKIKYQILYEIVSLKFKEKFILLIYRARDIRSHKYQCRIIQCNQCQGCIRKVGKEKEKTDGT